VRITSEKLDREQKYIINAVQDDMNKPGPDNTNTVLEEVTDLDKMQEIVQPLVNLIEEVFSDA